GVMAAESPFCEFRNCVFFGDKITCCVEWNVGGGERGGLMIDNCLLAGAFHGLVVNLGEKSKSGGTISIQRNTLTLNQPITFSYFGETPDEGTKAILDGKPLRMEVNDNVMATPCSGIL